jgi:hypothetical protein
MREYEINKIKELIVDEKYLKLMDEALEENLFRLLESYWGFTTSQKSLHRIPKAEFIVPNWLTFLSHEQTKKINLNILLGWME